MAMVLSSSSSSRVNGAWVKYRSADDAFLVEASANATADFIVESERAFYLAEEYYESAETRSPTLKPTRARLSPPTLVDPDPESGSGSKPSSRSGSGSVRPTGFPTHTIEDWSFLRDVGEAVTRETDARVRVYVIDTGCDATHAVLRDRVRLGPSFVPDEATSEDFHGHGTHVAGILARAAPFADIVCLKVFDVNGLGYTAPVVKAVRYAQSECRRGAKCVINFSGGAVGSTLIQRVMNDAVAKHDIVVVAPVGNYQQDSCRFAPGNAEFVLGVGACDHRDAHAYAFLSGFGPCARVAAPGVEIVSSFVRPWIWRARSGTSMATPIVAAVAALVRSREPDFRAFPDVYDVVVNNAVARLSRVPGNTPNRLVQMDAAVRTYAHMDADRTRLVPQQWRYVTCLSFEATLPLTLAFGRATVRFSETSIASDDLVVERHSGAVATYKVVRQGDRVAVFENDEVVWTKRISGDFGLGQGLYRDIRSCQPPDTAIHVPCHQLAPEACRAPCIWHGPIVGCRRALYCRLAHPNACRRSPLCEWTAKQKCERRGNGRRRRLRVR